MSDMAMGDMVDPTVSRVPVWTRPPVSAGFTPWSSYTGWGGEEAVAPSVSQVIDPAAIREAAFHEGFAHGRESMMAEFASERMALGELAGALDALKPEAPAALGMLLAETIERLVRQVIGEVMIDRDQLLARAEQVAALVAEEVSPTKMRVHPLDAELLADAPIALELVADPHLARGTILVETGSGWIEDGPDVRLEKLRSLLDRLGVPE